MSEQRISELEKSVGAMQVSFGKIESTLQSIDENLRSVLAVKEEVIIHREKIRGIDTRLTNVEWEQKENEKKTALIDIKMALMAGASWVIAFLLQIYLTK